MPACDERPSIVLHLSRDTGRHRPAGAPRARLGAISGSTSHRCTAASPTPTSWPPSTAPRTWCGCPASAPNCSASTAPTRPRPRSEPRAGHRAAGARQAARDRHAHHRRWCPAATWSPTPFTASPRRGGRAAAHVPRERPAARRVPDPPRRRVARARRRRPTASCRPPRTVGCTSRAGASKRRSPSRRCRRCRATTTCCPATCCSRTTATACGCSTSSTPGMNDRFFDLGNLSVNCGLDTAADEELLRLYFGEVTPVTLGAPAADEDDERVPRGHVGGGATGDQHARHRLRRLRRTSAWATASAWQHGPSSSSGSPTQQPR